MKTKTSWLLLLTALLLTGCWQKSIQPFYAVGDLDFDQKLAGTWKEKKDDDKGDVWRFTVAGDKRYDLVISADENDHKFDAHLFKLNGSRLLDIYAEDRAISIIPAHHLFKVLEIGTELKLAALNTDWVQKWLRQHPDSLAHVSVPDPEHRDDREKDELVLTADTKALQKFLREHWDDSELFVEPTTLKPRTDTAVK